MPGLSVTLCLCFPVAAAVILSTGDPVDDDAEESSGFFLEMFNFTDEYNYDYDDQGNLILL